MASTPYWLVGAQPFVYAIFIAVKIDNANRKCICCKYDCQGQAGFFAYIKEMHCMRKQRLVT